MSEEVGETPSKDDEDTSSDTKEELELSTDVRDIGSEAVWSLSTAKPGNGIDQVRDSNVRRYLTIRTSNNKHTTTYTDGYILAIGWSATSFSKHTVLEKDIDLWDRVLRESQVGRELHSEEDLHSNR